MKLDIEKIYLFSTIVEKGNFSKAAAHIGVNVSTVTRKMNNLEQSIGTALFIRSSRSLGLTEAGHILYQKSKHLLKDISGVINEIKEVEKPDFGTIRMSCLPTFGKLIIIPMITNKLLQLHNINIHLNLTETLTNPISERLDLTVRIGEQPDSNLYSKSIGTQTWHICASPKLLSQFTMDEIKSFTGLPLIDKYAEHNSLCWKGIEKSNLITYRCNDFHAQLLLALEGVGFCCLPNWVIAASIASGDLINVMDAPFQHSASIYSLRPFLKVNSKIMLFMDLLTESLHSGANITTSPLIPFNI